MKKKIIIIGAGVGGLATAVYLLSKGAEVTILEKNNFLGGRCGEWCEGDFHFARGAVLVQDIGEYEAVFRAAGQNLHDYVDVKRLKVNFDFINRNNHQVFSGDLTQMLMELRTISAKTAQNYLQYTTALYGRHQLREQYQHFADDEILTKKGSDRSHYAAQIIKSYITNPKIREALLFQSAYPGQELNRCSFSRAMTPAVMQMEGVYHFIGGMASFIQALAQLVVSLGGIIETTQPVSEIVMAGHEAVGVKTADNVRLADIVICNASAAYASEKLLPKAKTDTYTDDDFHHSCGVLQLHLALDTVYHELKVHNCYYDRSLTKALRASYHGYVAPKIALYVYYPAVVDHTLAPKGQSVMTAVLRVPNETSQFSAWNSRRKNRIVKRMMTVLTQDERLSDLSEHIISMSLITPTEMKRDFNVTSGSAFGTINQPIKSLPTIAQLYFIGDAVDGNAGVHRILQQSRILSEQILAEKRSISS